MDQKIAFDFNLRCSVPVPAPILRAMTEMNPPATKDEIIQYGALSDPVTAIVRARMAVNTVPEAEETVQGLRYSALAAMGAGIYFVQEEGDGPIKIGFASNIAKRFFSLQTGNPRRLHLLAAVKGAKEDEQAWHRRFAHARLVREWFNPVPELLAEIEAL